MNTCRQKIPFSKTIWFKNKIRGLWQGYFNLRYLNVWNAEHGIVLQHSSKKWSTSSSPLFFRENKMNELFEDATKAKYIAASLLSVDIAEVSCSLDNFKEGYPYTSAYAKFNKILVNKEKYTLGLSDYYLEEVNKCFTSLEEYCKVYETVLLLSSFAEEVRLYNHRLYIHYRKKNLKHLFTYNTYDTIERLHADLKILLANYLKILKELESFPDWKEKFEVDVSKLFAFSNINIDAPEIYELVDRQKIFK